MKSWLVADKHSVTKQKLKQKPAPTASIACPDTLPEKKENWLTLLWKLKIIFTVRKGQANARLQTRMLQEFNQLLTLVPIILSHCRATHCRLLSKNRSNAENTAVSTTKRPSANNIKIYTDIPNTNSNVHNTYCHTKQNRVISECIFWQKMKVSFTRFFYKHQRRKLLHTLKLS